MKPTRLRDTRTRVHASRKIFWFYADADEKKTKCQLPFLGLTPAVFKALQEDLRAGKSGPTTYLPGHWPDLDGKRGKEKDGLLRSTRRGLCHVDVLSSCTVHTKSSRRLAIVR